MIEHQGLAMRNAFVDYATQVAVRESAAQGAPIVCAKGCHWCCRQWTDATEEEAGVIARWLLERTRQGDPAARALVRQLYDYCRRLSVRRRDTEWDGIEDDEKPDRHWDFDLYCPFLSEERECQVYELRPFVCRTYLVADSADGCMTGGCAHTVTPDFEYVFAELMDSRADTVTKRAMQEGYRYQHRAFREPTDLLPVAVARAFADIAGASHAG